MSKHKPTGDCFEAAIRTMLELLPELTPILVHGEATGRGKIEGTQHAHAWVEVGALVLDYSNGKDLTIPKELYYGLGKVKNTVRYSPEEARAMMVEKGTFGPWDDYLLKEVE